MTEYFLIFPQGKSSFEPNIVGIEVNDSRELLQFFYDTIRCESIETVKFRGLPALLAIVDEEGLFSDNKLNWIASALYGMRIFGIMVVGKTGFRDGEPDIVGFESKDEAYKASRMMYQQYMKK